MYVAYNEVRQRVNSTDAEADASYCCPDCEEDVYLRAGTSDKVATHFAHYPDSEQKPSCGESDLHRKLKSIATDELTEMMSPIAEESYTEDHPEKECLTVQSLREGKRKTQPDAVVRFTEDRDRHEKWGKGIAVEIQVSNENKDIERTTKDLLKGGWSVLWLTEDDFADEELTFRPGYDSGEYQDVSKFVPQFPNNVPHSGRGVLSMSGFDSEISGEVSLHVDYSSERIDIEKVSWKDKRKFNVKLPPEAVAKVVDTNWDNMFGYSTDIEKISSEIDELYSRHTFGIRYRSEFDTEAKLRIVYVGEKSLLCSPDGHSIERDQNGFLRCERCKRSYQRLLWVQRDEIT
jgi:ribosomal protein L37AE/L43A